MPALNDKTINEAISNFIIQVCLKERYIELRRQMLCDNSDFEPYVAYSRLSRDEKKGISARSIQNFLKENSIPVPLMKCSNLVEHYDTDKDGKLNYMEFLEMVLPKEHPDLRAFIAQREVFEISEDEYLSGDTEISLAVLLDLEIGIFEDLYQEKKRLDMLELNPIQIVMAVGRCLKKGMGQRVNLNFDNLRIYLNECGLLPYDSEIISFLRRVDRDDDGVINVEEFESFMKKFKPSENPHLLNNRQSRYTKSRNRVMDVSPIRKIAKSSVLSLAKGNNKENNKTMNRAGKNRGGRGSEDSSLKRRKSRALGGRDRSVRPVNRVLNPSKSRVDKGREALANMNPGYNDRVFDKPRDQRLPKQPNMKLSKKSSLSNISKEALRLPLEGIIKQREILNEQQKNKPEKIDSDEWDSYESSEVSHESIEEDQRLDSHRENVGAMHRSFKRGNRDQINNGRYGISPQQMANNHLRRMQGSQRDALSPSEFSSKVSKPNEDHIFSFKNDTKNDPISPEPYNPGRNTRINLNRQQNEHYLPKKNEFKPYNKIPQTPGQNLKFTTPACKILRRSITGTSFPMLEKFNNNSKPVLEPLMKQEAKPKPNRKQFESLYPNPSAKLTQFCFELSKILAQEEELEMAKLILTDLPEFSISKIYNFIDYKQKGSFDFEDFREFLVTIGVQVKDTRSLIDLYSSFDVKQMCYLGYEEVQKMIMPISIAEFRDYHSEKNYDSISGELSQVYKDTLKEVFLSLFKTRKVIMDVKKILKIKNVNLNEVFEELDRQDLGFTTTSGLLGMLVKVKDYSGVEDKLCHFRPSAVELFMNRINLSGEKGVINFKDFYIFFSL